MSINYVVNLCPERANVSEAVHRKLLDLDSRIVFFSFLMEIFTSTSNLKWKKLETKPKYLETLKASRRMFYTTV